jgi:DNA-binding HxlR family transcriptional regulator
VATGDHRSCAAVEAALAILGRPWTGLVLFVLQDGPLRFSELSARVAEIGDKMLSARLKELERKGFVARHVHPGPPVRVSYQLTPKGASFREVLEAIDRWGREHLVPRGPRQRSRAARKAR